jgi:iron complex transport system ATP-binding protein
MTTETSAAISALDVRSLTVGHGARALARDVSFALARGEALAVLGPNGSGKTTLFRTLLGLVPTLGGRVDIDGRARDAFATDELARAIAYVPQLGAHMGVQLGDFNVIEVVAMARAAHLAWYDKPGPYDHQCALDALDVVAMRDFAWRRMATLSGGEQQLVFIARAIASSAKTLLLDEPTASLDYGNQLRVLNQLGRLKSQGYAILFTTHHPEQAMLIAERTLAIDRADNVTLGDTRELLTASFIAKLYDVREEDLLRMKLEGAI